MRLQDSKQIDTDNIIKEAVQLGERSFAVLLICKINVDMSKLTWSLLTVVALVQYTQCMLSQAIIESCTCIMPQQACAQCAVVQQSPLAAAMQQTAL